MKVLAARRGRPVTRAYLCELLWPDDDPAKTGHRLSVLLATVRGVLDSERDRPPDYYLAADQRGIWLDLRHADLDADRLLARRVVGGRADGRRGPGPGSEILGDIEARYPGDAFAEEPYEAWADGLREEVRASWQRSMRRLASLHSREGAWPTPRSSWCACWRPTPMTLPCTSCGPHACARRTARGGTARLRPLGGRHGRHRRAGTGRGRARCTRSDATLTPPGTSSSRVAASDTPAARPATTLEDTMKQTCHRSRRPDRVGCGHGHHQQRSGGRVRRRAPRPTAARPAPRSSAGPATTRWSAVPATTPSTASPATTESTGVVATTRWSAAPATTPSGREG